MRQRLSQLPIRTRVWAVIISAASVVLVIGAVALLQRSNDTPALGAEEATTAEPEPQVSRAYASPRDAHGRVADHTPMATGGSPAPDVTRAIPADGGGGGLPLGEVLVVPGSVQLDFLFEFCWPECFRDGHFMDPAGSGLGSGPFTAGTPFHVRHGFPVDGPEPLGDGFDVVIYVTALDQPGEFGGEEIAETYRYTSDYVLRGDSDACGPTYRSQQGTVTCEWFVHEFTQGLPAGRHALWAVWEAPCAAWVDYGFTDSCVDPDEVMSLFSSGFDSPFGDFPPNYTEASDAGLTEDELAARFEPHDGVDEGDDFEPPAIIADAVRDQGQIFGTGSIVNVGSDSWSQSITAGIEGTLAGIQLLVESAHPDGVDLHLAIYEGGHPLSGTPVLVETVTFSNNAEELFIWQTAPAGLHFGVGDVFSFAFSASESGVILSGNDPPGYGRGELYRNGSPLPVDDVNDLAFITYVENGRLGGI